MGRKPAQKDGQPLATAFAKGAAAKPKAPKSGSGPKTAPKTKPVQNQEEALKVLPVVPEFGDAASKTQPKASSSALHQAVPPAKRKEFAEGSKESFGQALAAGASDEGHLEPHEAKRLCLESAARKSEKAVVEDLARAQADSANQEHQGTGLEMDTGAEGTMSKSSPTVLGGAELGNNEDEVRAAVSATEPSKGSNEKCPDVKPEVKPSSPPQEGKSKDPLLEETQSAAAALPEAKNAVEEAQATTVEKKDEDPASSAPLEPMAEKEDALSLAVKGEGADDSSLSSSALPSGGSVANESSKQDDAGFSALLQQGEGDATKDPPPEEIQSAALPEATSAGEEAQAATVEKKDEDPASSAPLERMAEKEDALSSAVKGEGADDGQRQDQGGGDLSSLSFSSALPSGGGVANESSKQDDAGLSALQLQGEGDATMDPPPEETQSAALPEAKSAGEEAQAPTVEKKDEDPASSAPLERMAEKEDALSSAVKGEGADDGQRQDQGGGDLSSLSFLQLCQAEKVWPMNRQNRMMRAFLLCSYKEKGMPQWTLRRKRLSLQQLEMSWRLPNATGREFCKSSWR